MISIEDVLDQVESAQARKYDVDTRMSLINPRVEGLKEGEEDKSISTLKFTLDGKNVGATRNGESSFLSGINVPVSFFRRSSPHLKQEMISEHFPLNNKKEVKVRLIDNNVRYIASSKYSIFDDLDVARTLSTVDNIGNLNIRNFSQSEEYFVLRLTTKDPIINKGKRVMYPGVQIMNSEIGKSSVQISYCLYEEICTNGMMAPLKHFRPFRQKHIGKKGMEELSVAASKKLHEIDNFIDVIGRDLRKMSEVPSGKVLEEILERATIPKVVKDKLIEKTEGYIELYGEESGLEVLSAYTEIARDLNWERRLEQEQIAGNILAYNFN